MTTNSPATRSAASGALAALGGLKQGLQNVQASIPTAGGEPILRMGRDGIWVYGGDNIEVEEGSLWAINPLSLKHGWICWKKRPEGSKAAAERYADILVPMHEPKPAFASLPVYQDGEWSEQTAITLLCVSGTDEGTQVEYKPSSIGGGNAMKETIGAIMEQLDKDPEHPVPVVELLNETYDHKVWKKTYVPILRIDHWVAMDGLGDDAAEDGQDQGTQEPEPQEQAPAAATGRRRAPAQAAAPAEEPPFEQGNQEDAQTQAAPQAAQGQGEVRRRRR